MATVESRCQFTARAGRLLGGSWEGCGAGGLWGAARLSGCVHLRSHGTLRFNSATPAGLSDPAQQQGFPARALYLDFQTTSSTCHPPRAHGHSE